MAAVKASVVPATASSKDAQFAATALRELGRREARPGAALESAFIAQGVLPALVEAVSRTPNVWTKRSAAKAVCFLQRRAGLMAAAEEQGVTRESIQAALEAAGKADFVCARWARESAKWAASQQVAALPTAGGAQASSVPNGAAAVAGGVRPRKKWFED